MKVTSIKTSKIMPGSTSLQEVLDKYLGSMEEKSILAITSKLVSVCEGNLIPKNTTNKEELIKKVSDYYLPASSNKYGYHFTITKNTLIGAAGIDESNGNGNYVLWPKNPQKTADEIRKYLMKRFNLSKVGVIITDSTSFPLRRGAIGLALSHSGFKALNKYVGTPDLFGRPYHVSHANVSGGLAISAVAVMGEGAEQTPLAVITDVEFVNFQDHDPTNSELAELKIEPEDDYFAPFFKGVKWKKGKSSKD